MVSFGEKELRKYGWKRGKGLGVLEDGITEPIVLMPKADNKGVGYSRDESRAEFDDEWWKQSYNMSVASVVVVVVSNKEEGKMGRKENLSTVENDIIRESSILVSGGGGDTKIDGEDLIERAGEAQGSELVTMCKKNESSKHYSSPCGKQKRIAKQEASAEKKRRNSVEFEFLNQST